MVSVILDLLCLRIIWDPDQDTDPWALSSAFVTLLGSEEQPGDLDFERALLTQSVQTAEPQG